MLSNKERESGDLGLIENTRRRGACADESRGSEVMEGVDVCHPGCSSIIGGRGCVEFNGRPED